MVTRKTIGFIVTLFFMTVPGFAQLNLQYDKYTLDNGLDVILYQDHSTPLVSVNVWYYVGSKNEQPGKTGFAHLFEHMMFQGSEHVGDDMHFKYIEQAGGTLNGSTSTDRTNYWEDLPNNYLELALWLESDRMGFLLPAMTQEKLDNQRAVVKNERRQNYDNRPYGLAYEKLYANLYPESHPYHWLTIGSMEDLSDASLEDVKSFFRHYYHPSNASLVIAGDFDPEQAKQWVKEYFGTLPAGPQVDPLSPPDVTLTSEKRIMYEDQVQLPRLYMTFLTPALFQPGDATLDILSSVLSGGKNSRLYKSLVYEKRIAKDVNAYQGSQLLGSVYFITATANPGHDLTEIEDAIWEDVKQVQSDGVTAREVQKAKNSYEASYIYRLERVGGFSGIANQMQTYNFYKDNPGYFNQDLARYNSITPEQVQQAARQYLKKNARVVLSVVPQGHPELQAHPDQSK